MVHQLRRHALFFALAVAVATATALALGLLIAVTPAEAGNGNGCETWYVEFGGTGDGTSKKSPFGSLAEAEAASSPCDTIAVLPSAGVLDGGIVLKDDQRLVGQGADPAADLDADSFSGAYALVANTSGVVGDGHAVTCLGTCLVDRIWISHAFHSGITMVDVVGDLTVRRSRVTNFNTSEDVSGPGPFPGTSRPYFAIRYRSDADANVVVRNSVLEAGKGTGIFIESIGAGQLNSRVLSVVVRDLTSTTPGAFVDGMLLWASENSRHETTVSASVVDDVQAQFGQDLGIELLANGAAGSGIVGNVRGNTISGVDVGVQLVTLEDGPNQGSAVVTHNETIASGVGIIGIFRSASAPEVDRMTVRHNTVSVDDFFARGIEIIVGADDDPRAEDHRGEWVIAHNDVSVGGVVANGVELAYESSTLSDSALIEHNTIIGDPTTTFSSGIQVAGTAEQGRKPSSDITVRHNDIQMSGFSANGMSFAAATGIIGVPAVPEWDLRIVYEHNCVQDTAIGYVVLDVFGVGFGTETFDLGGGDLGSVGFNSFIGTDADVAFTFADGLTQIGIPFPAFGPGSVPSSTLVAENNYWGDPFGAVVDDQVGGALYDTEPFRANGPEDCGIDGDG